MLTFLLAIAVVATPAIALLRLYAPNLLASEYGVLGTLAGLALHIVVLNYVPVGQRFVELAVAGLCGTGALALWKWCPARRTLRPSPEDRRYAWLFLVLVVAQFVLLLLPSLHNPLPLGNDPVYHVAISDKIVKAGGVPDDFLPYDPVAPTYTLGSHLLIAFGHLQTGLPIHRLYQFALPLFLVLMTGAIFHLGRLGFGVRAGFFGAFAFVFLSNWGSVDLVRWGSLPNAAGMAFFLGATRLLLSPEGRPAALLPALFVGALASTHHLSALIFGFVTVAWAVAHARRLGMSAPLLRTIAVSWVLGILLVVPGVWALGSEVLRSLRSSEQAALDAGVPYLNVVEPLIPIWLIPGNLGIVLFALSIGGLWMVARDRGTTPLKKDLLVWTATMAGVFVVLDWPLRWLIDAIWRRDLAILTPSRFLTDLSYPLCLFAGVGLSALWRRSRGLARLVVAVAPCYAVWLLLPLMAGEVPRDELQGMVWFSRSSPENSLLLQAPKWTTYVSGREGDLMVLREERLTEYTDRKRKLANQGSGAVESWMKTHGRPVYLWETRDLSVSNLEKIWDGDQAFIYRFVPRPE